MNQFQHVAEPYSYCLLKFQLNTEWDVIYYRMFIYHTACRIKYRIDFQGAINKACSITNIYAYYNSYRRML